MFFVRKRLSNFVEPLPRPEKVKKAQLQVAIEKTRPDTRLPKSHAGVQGPYSRSLDHLGRSSEVKK